MPRIHRPYFMPDPKQIYGDLAKNALRKHPEPMPNAPRGYSKEEPIELSRHRDVFLLHGEAYLRVKQNKEAKPRWYDIGYERYFM